MSLDKKTCIPCSGAIPPLTKEESQKMLKELAKGWKIKEKDKKLFKVYNFKDFKDAFAFVSSIALTAEEEGHHPNISFTWGIVEVEIWTHKVNGLTESDFILASKIDKILN